MGKALRAAAAAAAVQATAKFWSRLWLRLRAPSSAAFSVPWPPPAPPPRLPVPVRSWKAGTAKERSAAAAAAAAVAAAAAARGLSRGSADALVLGNYRIKLESSEITQRSAAEEAGDPETLKLARAPFAHGQLRDRGFSPLAAAAQPTPELALRFVPHSTQGSGEADRPTRTDIQTLPDTAGSKRIKEIRNDMKKISKDYRL